MRLCLSEAGSALRVSGVVAWLSALALVLTSSCTQPSFRADAEDEDESDGGGPQESEREERDDVRAVDAGAEQREGGNEPRDGGESPAMTEKCDGGACAIADAQLSSTMPDAGARDAGSEPRPMLDEVRAKWVGRYAARSAMFAFEGAWNGTARALSVIEIVPTPEGGLRMEEEMCEYVGDWDLVLSGRVKYRHSDTRGGATLQYDGEHFSSEQFALRAGYGAAPASCSPGATVMRTSDQTWLSNGTCDCARTSETPTSTRDCRLTDPDKDNQPGASLSADFAGTSYALRVAQELRVRLLDGYRLNGRLYADRWFEETTRLLSCTVDGEAASNSSCPLIPNQSCPSRYNQVEMVTFEEPITCARVIAMESALFLSPLPNFPVSCQSEVRAAAGP